MNSKLIPINTMDNRSVTVELLINVVTGKRVKQIITVNRESNLAKLINFCPVCSYVGDAKLNHNKKNPKIANSVALNIFHFKVSCFPW